MLVAHVVGASPFGGVIPYIDSLIEGAMHEGLKACVVCRDPRVVRYFDDQDITTINIRPFKRKIDPLADTASILNLASTFRRLRPTVVHTHTSKGGFIGRLAARSAHVPVIIHTVHGFAFHDFSSAVSTWAYSRLEKIAGSCCDALISVNARDKDRAINLGIKSEDAVHVVYNGIDPTQFPESPPDPSLKKELGLRASCSLVTFVGRLAPQKSPDTLIAGMATLADRRPDARLLIVGDGPLRGNLENQARLLGVSEKIRFLGFRTDINRILNSSDVFVLPSLWEGLPISLLEAMACRLPSVVSDIKGNNEVVEHNMNGMVFKPRNHEEMAKYVHYLLDNRLAARAMREKARETIENRFTKKHMVDQTMAIYRSTIAKKVV